MTPTNRPPKGSKGIGQRLQHAVQRRCDKDGIMVKELCQQIGVAKQTLHVHEQGAQIPRADMLERYAKALHVNCAWLAFGVGPMKAKTS